MIQEHDEPVLAYLQDIRVKMNDKKPLGYTLEFEFAENPYFTNKTLTKTYELKTDVDKTDPFSYEGPDLEKSIGCKIDWKPNKNVTVKLIKKKLKSRNKKAPPKIVTKEEKQESFFTYFDTPKVGASGDAAKQVAIKKPDSHPDDDDDDDALDEETAHDLYLMADFETGEYIKVSTIIYCKF
jgi:nucleosome assembly protein 1-like 1